MMSFLELSRAFFRTTFNFKMLVKSTPKINKLEPIPEITTKIGFQKILTCSYAAPSWRHRPPYKRPPANTTLFSCSSMVCTGHLEIQKNRHLILLQEYRIPQALQKNRAP
jgi:hypothetical protein